MNYLKKIIQNKIFLVAVAVILIYTLAGFLLTPYLIRHYVPKVIQGTLKKQAAIGEVRVNPYILTFEANEFRLDESDERPIVGFKRLFVDFELKSLFKWAWTFRQIRLEGPVINAVIDKDSSLNLASLAPPSEAPSPQVKDEKPPRLIFEDIVIDHGQVDITDQRQSKPAAITLKPLNLQMKNLTTLPGQEGEKTITVTSGDGETFKWTGNISLNPVATKGSFSIENLRISTLSEFIRDTLNLDQPAGKLSVTADYSIDLKDEKTQVILANLSVALTGIALKLRDAETPFLELPDTLISGCRLDLSARQMDIGSIRVKGGRAHLLVDENGTLNMQRITASSEAMATSVPIPPAQDNETKPWKINLNGLDVGGLAIDYRDLSRTPGLSAGVDELKVGLKAEFKAGNQPQVLLSDIAVSVVGVQAGFLDVTEPVFLLDTVALDGGAYDLAVNRLTATKISIEDGNADVQRQADGAVNLALLLGPPKKGAVAKKRDEAVAKGHPFQFLIKTVLLSGLQVSFTDLMIRDDTPMLSLDDVSVAVTDVDGTSPMKFNLDVKVREGGQIKVAGTVDPSIPSVESDVQVAELGLVPFQPYINQAAAVILKSGAFSTQGTLRHGIKAAGAETTYQGRFNIENLLVTETDQKEALVGWKSVQSEQLKLQLEPNGIEISEIRVSQPIGKIIIEKDGVLNLAKVIKSEPEPKKEESQTTEDTAANFPYHISSVLIGDGEVDFADLSLPIPFGTKIHELKGNLVGISSAKNARARIKLDGRVNDYGTAKVEGQLDTSDPKAFTDIGVVFRNVEMSRLTPYSGKFAGRKIDSGKLSVDLKYKIDKSQLAGDNQIIVERLSLGEKVESPDAVNLPLGLAVALLEDSNGVIDLGLPVHGNLDSPEFSYGALIGKAIVNLLTKIVTSPFRALGALIPGSGEETFKNVVFEPGSASVSPPEKEKLTKLAEALQKRPRLTLAVQGRYNPETDRAVLRTASLSRALATRLGQNLAPSVDPSPVDFISTETGKAIEAMFSERFGADALKTIKAGLKEKEDKAKKEVAAKGEAAIPASKTEDPTYLAKLLFTRLEEVEPVDDAALTQLADARARAIVAELSGPLAIPSERLRTKASASLNKEDPITAELFLGVVR